MSARFWIAIMLGMLIMLAAHAAVESVARFSDTAYLLMDTQASEAVVSDLATLSAPINGYGISAVSPFGFGKISFLDLGKCRSGNCAKLHSAAFVQVGQRRPKGSAFFGGRSDSGEMTALDFTLMMLFAGGLVAYQLDRKQSVLRRSALRWDFDQGDCN